MQRPTPAPSVGRILLVEDDPSQAAMFTLWLHAAGFDTEVCRDGTSALVRIEASPPDLLICDDSRSGANDWGVSLRAAAQAAHLPTMTLIDENGGRTSGRAPESDPDTFLFKPVIRHDLVERARALVGQGRAAGSRPVVVAIGAHPDDVEIGCGGALLGHRAAGADITILTLSRGACGGPNTSRADDASRAARTLGATLILSDPAAPHISVSSDTVCLIEEVVKRLSPTTIYTHSAHDLHPDHRAVHRACMIAAGRVPELLCYQSPSSTTAFRPDRFLDVGAHLDDKLELLRCYSTPDRRPCLQAAQVRAAAAYWGRFGGWRPVEPLEVIRAAPAAPPRQRDVRSGPAPPARPPPNVRAESA